jgi:hypothetical protein
MEFKRLDRIVPAADHFAQRVKPLAHRVHMYAEGIGGTAQIVLAVEIGQQRRQRLSHGVSRGIR